MTNKYDLIEKIYNYIRNKYRKDINKMNRLIWLLKINHDNIEKINNFKDFKIIYNQSKGYEKELLEIISRIQ